LGQKVSRAGLKRSRLILGLFLWMPGGMGSNVFSDFLV
jgi:hypothetical protein